MANEKEMIFLIIKETTRQILLLNYLRGYFFQDEFDIIHIPVNWNPGKTAEIRINGDLRPYQVFPVSGQTRKLQGQFYSGIGSHELSIPVTLPGLQITIAKVKFSAGKMMTRSSPGRLSRKLRGLNSPKRATRRTKFETINYGPHQIVLTNNSKGTRFSLTRWLQAGSFRMQILYFWWFKTIQSIQNLWCLPERSQNIFSQNLQALSWTWDLYLILNWINSNINVLSSKIRN